MRYLVNSSEMKRYDQNTTEHFFIPSIVLMERAAAAFVEELKVRKVNLAKVLVVCGTGNNGGDGLAIARMLKLEHYDTTIVFVGRQEKVSEQNLRQQKILEAYGFEIERDFSVEVPYTAVIDAVFGVGLSRTVTGVYAEIIEKMNVLTGTKIAVDIASGISADNGAVLGIAFRAELSVTFAYIKVGMLLWPGNEYTGEIAVKEIGIPEESFMGAYPHIAALEESDFHMLPPRKSHSNKGTYGRLLIVAGSVNMAGAAVLSAKAAYAAGCGLVKVLTPEENRLILQTSLPEAVLMTYQEKEPDLARVLEALHWADAIVCGPGMGMSDTADMLVHYAAEHASVPLLLDADALNLAARNTSILSEIQADIVITPHLGEMGRLIQKSVPDIQENLIACAEEVAEKYHVICVLKDERTVISLPGKQTYLNLSGNPGMATAGSGDVLSGIIGSLLAQGMKAVEAAPFGAYLHGKAGDTIAEQTGMRGLMASDLVDGLRLVLKAY